MTTIDTFAGARCKHCKAVCKTPASVLVRVCRRCWHLITRDELQLINGRARQV